MGCNAKMEQVVPTKYDAKIVEARCGQTSIYGTELRCEKCATKRPWYICRHGTDVRDQDCIRCELA